MRFALMVTGPAYGTQQASTAWQFAQALLAAGHELASVFFYREGVYNANQLTAPASDEFDLVRAWQALHLEHQVELHICVAAGRNRRERSAACWTTRCQPSAGLYPQRLRRVGRGGVNLRSRGAVLMKSVAFVFNSAPHGSSAGREGLDALLAMSALTEEIGVFFLGDGVFQLLANQRPDDILARDYIATFKVLPLYDIEQLWLCAASLRERGLSASHSFILNAQPLEPKALRECLHRYDVVMTF